MKQFDWLGFHLVGCLVSADSIDNSDSFLSSFFDLQRLVCARHALADSSLIFAHDLIKFNLGVYKSRAGHCVVTQLT